MNWVLGLRQEAEGDPDRWVLDPLRLEGINHAIGEMPHRLGLIRVSWYREAGVGLKVEIEAPEGVTVRSTPDYAAGF